MRTRKIRKIKPQWYNADPLRFGYLESLADVIPLPRTDAYDPVCKSRKKSLYLNERKCLQVSKIAVENMAVKGVNQLDLATRSSGKIQTYSVQTPERPCLGCMRMNDTGPDLCNDPPQGDQRAQITKRRYLPPQSWKNNQLNSFLSCEI